MDQLMSNDLHAPEPKGKNTVRPTEIKDWLTYETMSPLGRSLMDIAKQIEESDEPAMDEYDIEQELLNRRVGYTQNTK